MYLEKNIKRKIEEGEANLARPFDREKDMTFKRLDSRKTRDVIDSAPTGLSSKFSSAKRSS